MLILLWRESGQPALQAALCDTRRKAVGEFDGSIDIRLPRFRPLSNDNPYRKFVNNKMDINGSKDCTASTLNPSG
jgi:hypothetical protein